MIDVEKIRQWYQIMIDNYISSMQEERNPYQLPMLIFSDGTDTFDMCITGVDEYERPCVISLVEFLKQDGGKLIGRIEKGLQKKVVAIVYWCHLYMIQDGDYEKSLLLTHLFHPLSREVADTRYFMVEWHNDTYDLEIEEIDHTQGIMEINNPDVELLFKNPFA